MLHLENNSKFCLLKYNFYLFVYNSTEHQAILAFFFLLQSLRGTRKTRRRKKVGPKRSKTIVAEDIFVRRANRSRGIRRINWQRPRNSRFCLSRSAAVHRPRTVQIEWKREPIDTTTIYIYYISSYQSNRCA